MTGLYPIAERFTSIQGEGVWTGTPMAFARFVGCSVGKKVCHRCDTDFETVLPWRGGGEFYAETLVQWAAANSRRLCLTGGEPFDQDLGPLLHATRTSSLDRVHIETSGTKIRPFLPTDFRRGMLWVCVSPKPGWLEEEVLKADEVKVIVPGLGNGQGWPVLEDALRWAKTGVPVYLQPRNDKHTPNAFAVAAVRDLLREHPMLRLSAQLHKYLGVP